MKKHSLSLCLASALTTTGLAAPIVYDSFNYASPGTVLSTAGAPAWSLYTAGQVDPKIASGSLSYPGLATAPGDNSLVFDGVAPAAGITSINLDQLYNINNVTTLYYSLTFQVTNINLAGDWGASAANFTGGSFMMGFNQRTTGTIAQNDAAAPLLIRTGDPNNVGGNANGFQQFQLGTGVTATTAVRTFDSTHNYNPGDTLFLVLSYTFNPGANDDVARLFVNPIPGSLESANIPVVSTTGFPDVVNNQAQTFFVRNNSVEPTSTVVDDLRIGKTWADVTPVPEPATVLLGGVGLLSLLTRRRLAAR